MNKRYLPASRQAVSSVINQVRMLVIDRQEGYVVIRIPTAQQLVIGQRLQFDSGVFGMVQSVDSSAGTARILLAEELSVEYAITLKTLLRREPEAVKIYTQDSDLGDLSALCRNTGTSQAGMLGWSLYRDGVKLLDGSDYYNKDTCSFTGGSLWAPAKYTLKVVSFHDLAQPLRSATRVWQLTTKTRGLYAGQYTDRLGSILMR